MLWAKETKASAGAEELHAPAPAARATIDEEAFEGTEVRSDLRVVLREATKDEPLGIDGSAGEGGGQILRTSLALSMMTGTPFALELTPRSDVGSLGGFSRWT